MPPHRLVRRLFDSSSSRGQALVEFGVLLPLLLVILLGVADFARVFQAGIIMESASRAAAEAVALEYLRDCPKNADGECDPTLGPIDYSRLHELGAQAACEEARILANTTYDGADRDCDAGSGDHWPAVLICVHDASDPPCGTAITGYASTPPGCDRMSSPAWTPTIGDPDNTGYYVEVRVCYRFTTLWNVSLPMDTGISIGQVFLEKDAHFTIADY